MGPGLRANPRKNSTFNLSLRPQGCERSLEKWLHNNLISIVGICLGVGLLEVSWSCLHSRLALQSLAAPNPRKLRIPPLPLGKAHA